MQETLTAITNGVEVGRIHETIAAVRENPQAAKFNFRIQNRWLNGGENLSEVRAFYAGGKLTRHKTKLVLSADEPDVLLGTDNGANPVEHLLHALASCVTTSMVYHAAARGIALEQIESTLEGDLDLRGFLGIAPQIRNGYQNIRLTVRVKASGLTDEELRDLTALGPRFSPVYDSLTRGVPVEFFAERIA
jgi:uncharacterized OsmC-like protein